MDGTYIEVVGENGCKATTEMPCKRSSGGLDIAIKAIKRRLNIYNSLLAKDIFNETSAPSVNILYGRKREAEDILEILEEV